MYDESALLYDAIYSFKDYQKEASIVRDLVERNKRTPGKRLLDVGCGTGSHLAYLRQHFDVEGLDITLRFLEVARERLPGVALHHADMTSFDLGCRFDAVVCLFSAIGYANTKPLLNRTIKRIADHLLPGGVLVLEPWLTPEVFRTGQPHAIFVDRPDLKIARLNVGVVENGLSVLDFHYLVATPEGVEYFPERHELGLFAYEDYAGAMRAAGMEVFYDPEGLTGRGLFIGRFEGPQLERLDHDQPSTAL